MNRRLSDPAADADRAPDPGPGSIMSNVLASNRWVVVLTVLSMLSTALVLYLVVRNWNRATVGLDGPAERDVLLMIILMGALGGLVHSSSSLAKYVGNRELKRSWIIYYLLMPIEGAALAPTIYLLLRAGVLTTPGPNASSTAHLNVAVLYGFASLTGLFSKQAIEMLADVFATVFKRVKAKDALENKGETPGTGAPTTPTP